jgi:hypothetical protein
LNPFYAFVDVCLLIDEHGFDKLLQEPVIVKLHSQLDALKVPLGRICKRICDAVT